MSRVALDSNILAYLAGVSVVEADEAKIKTIRSTLKKLRATAELIAPIQALGETFVVLRRSGISIELARTRLAEIAEGIEAASSTDTTLTAALDLVVEHKLQFWDSMILTAAAEAKCSLLLSEDMQDGFVIRGVTIVNPLADKPHEKLARLLT